MKYLFFDIAITGHHTEYIGHIVDYLSECRDNNKYIFVVHPLFSEKFSDISEKAKQNKNITWIEITEAELIFCQQPNLIKQSIASYKLMNTYATRYNAKYVLLLYLNTFQFALIPKHPNYKIGGILFMPFNKMKKDGIKNKMKFYRKYIQTLLFIRNKSIESVFILNDLETVKYLNKEFCKKQEKFKFLIDPIPDLQPLPDFEIYSEYKIEKERKIFFHFGSLAPRKGTLDILKAIDQIPETIQNQICILIVGRCVNQSFTTELTALIDFYKRNSSVQIVLENDFISNAKMRSLFDQSECILMPYTNTEGSSGVLGQAAASGKPVISYKSGIVGELIEKYNLGITINNKSDLPSAFLKIVENDEYICQQNTNFVSERSPNIFCNNLLKLPHEKI